MRMQNKEIMFQPSKTYSQFKKFNSGHEQKANGRFQRSSESKSNGRFQSLIKSNKMPTPSKKSNRSSSRSKNSSSSLNWRKQRSNFNVFEQNKTMTKLNPLVIGSEEIEFCTRLIDYYSLIFDQTKNCIEVSRQMPPQIRADCITFDDSNVPTREKTFAYANILRDVINRAQTEKELNQDELFAQSLEDSLFIIAKQEDTLPKHWKLNELIRRQSSDATTYPLRK